MSLPAVQKASPFTKQDAARVAAQCDDWAVERKFDGHRIVVGRAEDGTPFVGTGSVSGSGRDKTWLVPHIAEAVRDLPPGTVLDGEAIGGDDDEWNLVQSVLGRGQRHAESHRVRFVAFDVLSVSGRDVCALPLRQRRQLLESCVGLCDQPTVSVSTQHSACDAQEVYERIVAAGGEGVVLKQLDAAYQPGKRSKQWLKMKLVATADVVVTGAVEGGGKYAGQVGALTFATYQDGQLVPRGQCSGMTDAERQGFTELWREGGLEGVVIEVSYNGQLGAGLRHPQYKRVRTDKAPEECTSL